MTFNIGRVYESKGEIIKATEIYNQILNKNPSYVDCYLRLSLISKGMYVCIQLEQCDFSPFVWFVNRDIRYSMETKLEQNWSQNVNEQNLSL